MKKNNENINAFLIHICGFAGFLYPFGSIITPLIAWQTLKERSQFLDEQGKEAVNFNISFSFYKFLAAVIFIPFAIGKFFNNQNHFHNFDWFSFDFDFTSNSFFSLLGFGPLVGIIVLIRVVLTISAALKAKEG